MHRRMICLCICVHACKYFPPFFFFFTNRQNFHSPFNVAQGLKWSTMKKEKSFLAWYDEVAKRQAHICIADALLHGSPGVYSPGNFVSKDYSLCILGMILKTSEINRFFNTKLMTHTHTNNLKDKSHDPWQNLLPKIFN